MKTLNHILNIVIGVSIGSFIGFVLYDIWKLIYHPEIYAAQALPFRTFILLRGIFPFIIVVVCLVIKVIIKRNRRKVDF